MSFLKVPSTYFLRIRSTFTPEKAGEYRFGVSVWGRATLYVDGKEVIDQWTSHPEKTADTPMFNKFSMEKFANIYVEKGKAYPLELLMTNDTGKSTVDLPGMGGLRLGGHFVIPDDKAIEDAVQVARCVDVPIVMVGLSSDYEYEGTDRCDLMLPGQQNTLVEKVVEANPNTVR